MTTLHLVRCSAFKNTILDNCLSVLNKEDTLVLLDDGAYNLQHPVLQQVLKIIPQDQLIVVKNHAQARGIIVDKQLPAIALSDVIELSLKSAQSITWQ